MPETKVPICQHIKACGCQCGVPALKGRRYCHFHDDAEKRRRASARLTRRLANRARRSIQIPVLEDANAVQVALMETMNAFIDQRLDHKDAALLFYALQTASANVKSMELVHRPPAWKLRSDLFSRLGEINSEIRNFEKWEGHERDRIRTEVKEELRKQAEAEPQKKAVEPVRTVTVSTNVGA